MEKNPKRQRRTPGSILRIDLEDGYYCYAQILDAGVAFFDIHTKEKELKDLNILLNAPVLFIIGVYTDVISQGKFLKIGKLPIREDLKNQPMNYIEDILATDKNRRFELYNPSTGEITACTQDQAWGLERCAVWDYNHSQKFTGRACDIGRKKHKYAEKMLKKYQKIYGDRGLLAENYFKARLGKARLDVFSNETHMIYDYKFGKAGLSNRQKAKYLSIHNSPAGIMEIRPEKGKTK